jgi:hypothetical protein
VIAVEMDSLVIFVFRGRKEDGEEDGGKRNEETRFLYGCPGQTSGWTGLKSRKIHTKDLSTIGEGTFVVLFVC